MLERRQKIAELVVRTGQISFAELKKAFPDVSEMTLRTDLKSLDEEGQIIRIHGGARSIETLGSDGPLSRRTLRNPSAKREIAEKAAALLKRGASVFLDSGSTTTCFAKYIPDEPRQIFTCSISCAAELAVLTKPEVYLIGGRLNRDSLSLAGSRGLLELQSCHFDICFLGVSGFMPGVGFGCEAEADCILKQVALQQSKYRVALMDASKFGRQNTRCICPLEQVDAVVCDHTLRAEQRRFFLEHQIELI